MDHETQNGLQLEQSTFNSPLQTGNLDFLVCQCMLILLMYIWILNSIQGSDKNELRGIVEPCWLL